MSHQLTYRDQAQGEVHVVTSNPNVHAELTHHLKDRHIYVQALHPDGPTEPTLSNNVKKIRGLILDCEVFEHFPVVARRVMDEADRLGLFAVALVPDEVREQIQTLLIEKGFKGVAVISLNDI